MSICPFPILNMICPRCKHKFEYDTFGHYYHKQECPNCKLPFINTNYTRFPEGEGMIISDWGVNIWARKCDDGEWRIPEGKYIFDDEEQKLWGVVKDE